MELELHGCEKNYDPMRVHSDRYFCCDYCLVWFFNIVDLFLHIEEEHEELEISAEVQDALFKKWEDILRVEKSIMVLVAENRYKSAKKTLKSSLTLFNNFTTDVFEPNDNIFKHFLLAMRSKLKLIIRESRLVFSNEPLSRGALDSHKEKPRKYKKRKRKNETESNGIKKGGSSDFSSDDDVCLKDSLEKIKRTKNSDEINPNHINTAHCSRLNEQKYYIIPEKIDGTPLNYSEHHLIRSSINDVIKIKDTQEWEFLKKVVLQKYSFEEDELLPEEAILVSEWGFSGVKCDSWDKMTVEKFLCKNILKQ